MRIPIADAELVEKVALIDDPRVRAMIGLARHLRFMEVSLFCSGCDFDSTRDLIKHDSKGGRPRYLLIHDNEARRLTMADSGLFQAEYAEVPAIRLWHPPRRWDLSQDRRALP